jgi:peroxiredoxin
VKNLLVVLLLLLTFSVCAQTLKLPSKRNIKSNHIFFSKGSAVIKGSVSNFIGKTLTIGLAGDIMGYSVSIPVDSSGDFSTTINFDKETEDVYLHLNDDDVVTICAQNNDVIEVKWNSEDINNTLSISSPNKIVNERLQTMLSVYKLYDKEYSALTDSLYSDKMTDTMKFASINSLYGREMLTVARHPELVTTRKLTTDVYFKYVSLLQEHKLLGKYTLHIDDSSVTAKTLNKQFDSDTYRSASEFAYRNSSIYKSFLYYYLGSGKTIDDLNAGNKMRPSVSNRIDNSAHSKFLSEMQDWYTTYNLKIKFAIKSFNEADSIYKQLEPTVKTARYKDTLKQMYAVLLQLKPGNPAPDFSLKNDSGKMVSLKDFRGKVVYIDFWGVGCAPCIVEIQHAAPYLQAKYKGKNVVFINICVDSDEKTWKNSLTSLKVEGINLIAEGWNRNPVCQKYNVTGIPHYVTIGIDGKIVNNASGTPSSGSRLTDELDKALAQQ